MPTWEQHQRALGRAREAGDAEAVAEIEGFIAGEAAASGAQPSEPAYDKTRYQKAMQRAAAAKDNEALEEIAVDWMTAADAAGKRSPAQYADDELTSAFDNASKAGDLEGVILTGVEMKRRKARKDPVGDVVQGIVDLPANVVGAVGAAGDFVGSGVENFGRGMDKLASGEKNLGDLGTAIAENVATGARSIPGADLLYAGGGNIVNMVEGEGVDPTLVQRAQQEQQAAAAENPLAAMAGEIAGAGVAANRVLKIPGVAVQAGQPGNIARTAIAGGVTEGAVGLVDTLDPQKAAERAVTGAVVAPIVGAAAKKVIDIAAPTARMALGKPAPAGMTKLAQLLKIPVAELEAARVSLKNARGSNPSIAEIVDTATIQRTQNVVASQPVVAKAAEAAADAGELARPTRLKEIVEGGGKTGSAKQATIERKAFFDDVMKTHGNRPVQFNNPSFLNKEAVVREIGTLARNASPQVRKVLDDFMDAVDSGKPGALRVRDIENIRVALSDAIKKNPALKEALGPVRERLNTIAGNQIPEYGQALKTYANMGEITKGLKEGGEAVTGTLADTKSNVGNAGRPRRFGQQVGTRTKLSEDVANSYGRSTQAAQELVDPALGDRVAEVMGRAEADRIATAGKQEAAAGRNLDALNPAPNPKATRPGNDANLALDSMAALGPAGAGYRANVLVNILNKFKRLGMSEQAAKGLSEALFDPSKAEDAVRVLKQIKAWDDVSALLAQKAAAIQAGTEGAE